MAKSGSIRSAGPLRTTASISLALEDLRLLWGSQCRKPTGAVLGAGVEVTAGGDDGGVAERGLHQVNGRPAVEGVGGMGMAHPVRGDRQIDAGAHCGSAHDAQHPEWLRDPPRLRERMRGWSSPETNEFLNLGETLIHYATGQNLDFIGEIFGVYRLGVQIASIAQNDANFKFYVAGGGTFGSINSGQAINILAGTQILTQAAGGPIFLTDSSFTLNAGDTQQFFSAYSATPGASANAAAGVFNQWAGNIPYSKSAFGSLLVTNGYGVVGGRDAETNDNYRYRTQQMLQGRNGANEAAMRFQLLQVPGIQDIVFTRLAGTFNCYV